jgi:hypothetical protein
MTTEKLKHAKLSASGSDRWLNCAGSVQLQEQFKKNYAEKTNKYAEEGTAAHELAEKCLEEIKKNDFCYCSPYEFLGQTFNDFVVDEEKGSFLLKTVLNLRSTCLRASEPLTLVLLIMMLILATLLI